MTLSDDEKWILAENLRRQEKETVDAANDGRPGPGGDFEAYHSLLTGKDKAEVSKHAVADQSYLAAYTIQFRAILDGENLAPKSILDAGCGHGPLTNALKTACPDADILGVDISESGVAYARNNFQNCRFEVMAIDEGTNFPQKFDVVHAREFYPFTRTEDVDFHKKYISILAKAVAPRGSIVLSFVSQTKSLSVNAASLSGHLAELGMSSFQRIVLADARLSFLPLSVSRLLTVCLRSLTGRPIVHFYISRRERA